jgi:hypothetical protein
MLHSHAHIATKTLVAASWAALVLAVIAFHADHLFLISKLIDIASFLGLGAALTWLVFERPFRRLCITLSGLVLILYCVRWVFLTSQIYETSQDLGILVAVERLLHLWRAEFMYKFTHAGVGVAILSIYWNVLAGLLQAFLIAAIVNWSANKPATAAGNAT